MSSQVNRPLIPYRGHIPGGLHEGKVVEIRGSVPYGADVFTINLVTGLDVMSDRPFHLSARFGGRIVVRNHFERNAWGPEERHGAFPFQHGTGFTITIVVEATQYKISVNHQHCWQFNHRIPLRRVSSILIEGCVQIERIEFLDRPASLAIGYIERRAAVDKGSCISPPYTPTPSTYQIPSPRGGSNLVPVYNPSIPYAYPIYGGLKQGMAIYINGIPSPNANRFTFNLQSGTNPHSPPDIALHLDARFWCATVVRNTRTNNSWEREETDLPRFPFSSGLPFELCIRVQKNRFAVELDGRHLLTFTHRLRPISRFDTLWVEGNLQVPCIRFG